MKKPARYYKQLAIEFWEYLRDHPEITEKITAVSFERYDEIMVCKSNCPCCEYFAHHGIISCDKCPLNYCISRSMLYQNWRCAKNKKKRAKAAQALLDQLAQWRVR